MIRILLCGEGVTDVGQKQVWNKRKGESTNNEGWLQPIVRKILRRRTSFEIRTRNELIQLPRDVKKHKPLPPGHGAKALMAKSIATREGLDAVIYMVDADGKEHRNWQEKRQEIMNGFDHLESDIPSIACVPKCTSESWLLSDENAWLHVGLSGTKFLPENPEAGWGKRNDPKGGHPHQTFARACKGAGVKDSRETRVDLANAIDLTVLAQKCPVSFGAFKDDLAQMPLHSRNCQCGSDCCS
jgi:hypothetical protein